MVNIKDYLDIISEGYNFQYVTITLGAGATTGTITQCPNGMKRIIMAACGTTATGRCFLRIVRDGATHFLTVPLNVASNGYACNLLNPIVLNPGDILQGYDPQQATPTFSCGYIDVLLDVPTYKKGRRG